MAKWERYIVYPLLMVALFFGLSRETRVLDAAQGVIDEIRARRVVVVDEDGQEQVVLETDYGGDGRLSVNNSRGTEMVSLRVAPYGGTLVVFNNAGTPVGLLRAYENGGVFGISNNAGTLVSGLRADENGGALSIYNSKGFEGALLVATENGGLVRTFNAQGDPRVSINTAEDTGHGGVWVYDKYGEDYRVYGYY